MKLVRIGAIGGVNSIGAVSHEWIDSINTAGLPHQSQPTFGDISGTLTPTQCPAATTSAQGCVEPDGTTIKIVGDQLVAATGGSGSFNGPTSSVAGDLGAFSDTTGKDGQDSLIPATAIHLPSPDNFYVATSANGGSDSNDCLSATLSGSHGPCLTLATQ